MTCVSARCVLAGCGPAGAIPAGACSAGTGPASTGFLLRRQRITDTSGYQVTGTQFAVVTSAGVAGVQGGYTAPGRGGRYTVFVTNGRLIEVTVSGADLDLGRTLPAIEASTRTLGVS